MCSSLEVRITSDGFRLPELPGTQWPAYVWGCQLLWYAHTLLYWQWNWSYFRIPKPVLSPTVVSSVKSNPENQTDLKQVLELVVRWKKYWFSKRALKLTEHCPLVPLGSQVFSALYRVNRDASCILRDFWRRAMINVNVNRDARCKRKFKVEQWSFLCWQSDYLTCYDQQEQKVHVADAAANKLDKWDFVCPGKKEHSSLWVMSEKLWFWSL